VGCPIIWAKRDRVIDVLRFLKNTEGYDFLFLSDLTCYDDEDQKNQPHFSLGRFVVVYNLYSPQARTRVRVKTRVADGAAVPTATVLWSAANWAEREVFDMFGVKFDGHPDLRRILMDIRWEGHPLRKEYPLRKYQLFNDPEQIPEHLLREDN
jgi:NADH/F420H2 dehydrogenase subunit C